MPPNKHIDYYYSRAALLAFVAAWEKPIHRRSDQKAILQRLVARGNLVRFDNNSRQVQHQTVATLRRILNEQARNHGFTQSDGSRSSLAVLMEHGKDAIRPSHLLKCMQTVLRCASSWIDEVGTSSLSVVPNTSGVVHQSVVHQSGVVGTTLPSTITAAVAAPDHIVPSHQVVHNFNMSKTAEATMMGVESKSTDPGKSSSTAPPTLHRLQSVDGTSEATMDEPEFAKCTLAPLVEDEPTAAHIESTDVNDLLVFIDWDAMKHLEFAGFKEMCASQNNVASSSKEAEAVLEDLGVPSKEMRPPETTLQNSAYNTPFSSSIQGAEHINGADHNSSATFSQGAEFVDWDAWVDFSSDEAAQVEMDLEAIQNPGASCSPGAESVGLDALPAVFRE